MEESAMPIICRNVSFDAPPRAMMPIPWTLAVRKRATARRLRRVLNSPL